MAATESGLMTRIIDLLPRNDPENGIDRGDMRVSPMISVVIYPKRYSALAKSFWQHTGEGVSSRRAELCHKAFNDGFLAPKANNEQNDNRPGRSASPTSIKGPLRYQKARIANDTEEHGKIGRNTNPEVKRQNTNDSIQFIEERYGRNLHFSLASKAKIAIRRRIAGALTADVDANRIMDIAHSNTGVRQIPGFSEDDVYLYPSGMSSIFNTHRTMIASRGDMKSVCFGFPYIDTLKILEKWGPGCLFYGNGSADDLDDLQKRCEQGEKYLALFCEFPGNPLLKCPDLRRIRALADRFDFAVVVDETIGNFLNIHIMPHADVVVSSLTKVFSGDSNVMGGSPTGGYGGLLSVTFKTKPEAIAFYDALETAKGPSLGTNFTLRSMMPNSLHKDCTDERQLSIHSVGPLRRVRLGE
ncbi:MAG: hypothetical protein Q9166_000829 [cf. Caloplaca sp. 2 TL-2023]